MKATILAAVAAITTLTANIATAQPDSRQQVELPPMMGQHMLANMRDHLVTLNTIHQALADADYERAAEVAERRLGMSSLGTHGASHMAPYMPQEMQAIGTAMHHAASRFAIIARESAVEDNMKRAVGALAEVSKQCIACHNAYRIR